MGCSQSKSVTDIEFYNKQMVKNRHNSPFNVTNSPISRSKSTAELFLNSRERSQILNSECASMPTKLLLSPPFSNFTSFSQQIYLTGLGGVTVENLKQYQIKCLVNVAAEIPFVDMTNCSNPSVVYHKNAIIDSYTFPINEYFDKITDQINKVIKQNDGNVLVYCIAGMSRSTTVVIAYAIKYLRMPLREAFQRVQEVRPYARPNLAFFFHLVQYERECLGTSSTEMVLESTVESDYSTDSSQNLNRANTKNKINEFICVPDFYPKEYPHLFKLEATEARNDNCPMVTCDQNAKVVPPTIDSKLKITKSHKSCKKTNKSNKIKVNQQSSKTFKNNNPSDQRTYVSSELKPFIVETVDYMQFLTELNQIKAKLRSASQTNASTSISSAKMLLKTR